MEHGGITYGEHMFSALPPIAAGSELCQHLRSAPKTDIPSKLSAPIGQPHYCPFPGNVERFFERESTAVAGQHHIGGFIEQCAELPIAAL
jgi:hypothetical protein